MPALTRKAVQPIIALALREDTAWRDATSRAVIPHTTRVRARIVAKASGILAGGPVAAWTFQTVDPSLRCVLKRRDGSRIGRGQTILTVEGPARSIFAAERTALNLLGHLSGIATLTAAFVARVRGTQAQIFDTRKTLPGLRTLEKYAVRAGGGHSHRASLAEAILIKTNHLRALRSGEWRVASGE
jgi:nicotinate-nucleotide pyrophosphorylase (carboxylating)